MWVGLAVGAGLCFLRFCDRLAVFDDHKLRPEVRLVRLMNHPHDSTGETGLVESFGVGKHWVVHL